MTATLLSPMVLFFALGVLAALARSDLSIPEAVGKAIAIYLMIAIGLKGGVAVAAEGVGSDLAIAAALGLVLSAALPLPAYWLGRKFAGQSATDAASIAAHYGSVSVVTFVAGAEALSLAGLQASGYMVAVLALMETPAIIVGLLLARRAAGTVELGKGGLLHEALFNGSVVLLVGSFLIGMTIGKDGFVQIAPVFEAAFRGILCLFLLDMGLVAARRLRDTRSLSLRLLTMAIALPLLNGVAGVFLASMVGLEPSNAAAMGILAASASYIAVPAAMRIALPQANAGTSLAMSLGVTFPFNVTLGIPLYILLAVEIAETWKP
ncbi:sodium-dependent bicarbonate transport family permease (plasmid) [Aureimonas sp. SA4125]|uniref:sodium-dependent bicarbonate transport family permease n=1 Tax=Aureimonas sp. SA4125 TaxID=2826993 RepID=UPI001CC585AE|nr:sodium-dependent bicarbonate transport family permease [Aureimonas sp. SA4125]BDA87272.1 sodium-dependent bicarbonate transport family permease [Aureimonas sp. SA4125]